MNKTTLTIGALAISTVAGGALGLAATAGAAPTGTASTQDVVDGLEEDGHQVIVNNLGNSPLAETSVQSISPARTVTEWVWNNQHDHRRQVTTSIVVVTVE